MKTYQLNLTGDFTETDRKNFINALKIEGNLTILEQRSENNSILVQSNVEWDKYNIMNAFSKASLGFHALMKTRFSEFPSNWEIKAIGLKVQEL